MTTFTSSTTIELCPWLPRPSPLLSQARWLNGNLEDMGQPYLVLQKLSCPDRWDMYTVRGCRKAECDPIRRPRPGQRGNDISVTLAYFRNKVIPSDPKYMEEAAITKVKLDDKQGHNIIPFAGKGAFSPTGFDDSRQGSANTTFWIDFHVCIHESRLVVLKIGSGTGPGVLTILRQEMADGAAKSYYWCRPGSVQIYLFKGASDQEEVNKNLKKCLRSKFVPASQEEDLGQRPDGTIDPDAGDSACAAACADPSTRGFHESMGCPQLQLP